MAETKEKFVIEVTDNGLDIISDGEEALHSTVDEALTLRDILQNEEVLNNSIVEYSDYKLKIVSPDSVIDYKILQVLPDTTIDFRIRIYDY